MTFAEIADELGVDERTVRRVIATVLERMHAETDADSPELLLAALVRGLRERNYFSTEEPTFSRVPRRFAPEILSGARHAPRAASPISLSSSLRGDRRAGLPRRWRPR